MNVDFNKMTPSEIDEHIEIARKEKEKKEQLLLKEAYKKFVEIAKECDCSIEEILAQGVSKGKGKIKYQNPDNLKEAWSGYGRKPKWLQSKLDNGERLEDYKV